MQIPEGIDSVWHPIIEQFPNHLVDNLAVNGTTFWMYNMRDYSPFEFEDLDIVQAGSGHFTVAGYLANGKRRFLTPLYLVRTDAEYVFRSLFRLIYNPDKTLIPDMGD